LDETSHIFICFLSKDEDVARNVVDFLEAQGLKCWISVRDVPPGQNYQEVIVSALGAAAGLVFLFSETSNTSSEIKKELSLAGVGNVPVFPLRLAPITPSGALRYELATRQWIDLFPEAEPSLQKLAATIRKVVAGAAAGAVAAPPATAFAPAPAQKRAREQGGPVVPAGSEEFEAIRALLARHIGPIAKVFVQKASTEARNPEDFCERIAAHVSAPADRAALLAAARARMVKS
jgi:TIR domain